MTLPPILQGKLGAPILDPIRQGLSPSKIALTVAIGFCLAIIPVIGVTTILCVMTAWAFRLNHPIIQAINWAAYPLQLLLIIPFIRMGERLFHAPRMRFSLEELLGMGRTDPFGTMAFLWATTWHAVVAWVIVTPFLIVLIFFAARPLFRTLSRRLAGSGAIVSAP